MNIGYNENDQFYTITRDENGNLHLQERHLEEEQRAIYAWIHSIGQDMTLSNDPSFHTEKQEEIKEQADYKKFKKMYEKRNPGISEENCIVEFMKLMEQKARKARKARNDCLQQIVTGLYNAMSKLNDGQEEPNVSEKS